MGIDIKRVRGIPCHCFLFVFFFSSCRKWGWGQLLVVKFVGYTHAGHPLFPSQLPFVFSLVVISWLVADYFAVLLALSCLLPMNPATTMESLLLAGRWLLSARIIIIIFNLMRARRTQNTRQFFLLLLCCIALFLRLCSWQSLPAICLLLLFFFFFWRCCFVFLYSM